MKTVINTPGTRPLTKVNMPKKYKYGNPPEFDDIDDLRFRKVFSCVI